MAGDRIRITLGEGKGFGGLALPGRPKEADGRMKSPRGLPRGDLFVAVSSVNKEAAKNGCRRQPADQCLYRLLERVDDDLASIPTEGKVD